MKQKVACILPVKNEEERIEKILDHYTNIISHDLIVVDAGSDDKTLDLLRDHHINNTVNVSVLVKINNGTTESNEWIDWLLQTVPSKFYVFLSCSEFFGIEAYNFALSQLVNGINLVYLPRISRLNGDDISCVYSKFSDLLLFRSSHFPICRFISRKALDSIDTHIHDNWLSQSHLVATIFSYDKNLSITHHKTSNFSKTVIKHLDYAKTEAKIRPQLYFHLIRLARELVYVLIITITLRMTRSVFEELLHRIIYRLMIIVKIIDCKDN